jgi:exodeoxyribonuclease VII small subunit
MSYEKSVRRLEAIVEELEAGDLELAKALKLFEEGISCLREATKELSHAEARVKVLVEKSDGVFELPDHDR